MTNKEMINKFKDYADIADASYAKLHYIFENIDTFFNADKWEYSDNISLGDKVWKSNKQEINTAYARCIEARFMKDVILEKGIFKDTTIDNNPRNVLLNSTLSKRTINFVNRYELVAHQPNTNYGFSATLFKDLGEINKETNARKVVDKDSRYILAIRGTEITPEDLSIDIILARNGIPMQCYELARFCEEQVKPKIENSKLVVVGHSLDGYLAQSFCFMYPDKVAKLYTFNSPGLLGAWNKDFADNLLSGFEVASYVAGGANIARKIGFKLLTKTSTTLKVMAVLGVLSLTINTNMRFGYQKNYKNIQAALRFSLKI